MVRLTFAVLVGLATFLAPLLASGQDSAQQIDQIFAAFNHAGSPGCSLGVIRDGQFLYRKSYGEASLELAAPLSPESVFYVGSISKQFTAAGIVLASEQGLLSLDDDVRKYIPELPDYGHTITLRQMLNQTSGLRDLFDLISFSGHNAVDFNSPTEILQLIERQKGLNNVPGAEWVYSNTNFFLLGIVLQRASGKTLDEYADQNVFRPLRMAHTRFYDDASAVVPGRVAAYDAGPKGQFLVDWSTTYAVVGAGGLMTTVDDLARWDSNFYADRLGSGTLVKQMEMPGVLNDGNKTAYGMGLMLGSYRGLPIVEHNGLLFGYRADLLRFPEQRFTVIDLCNVSNAEPQEKARQVADIYLKTEMRPSSTPISATDKDWPNSARFVGDYLDPRRHAIYSFTESGVQLQTLGSDLRRKNANQFYDLFGDLVTFERSKDSMKVSLNIDGETYFAGNRLSEIHLDAAALQSLAGNYRSAEVEAAIQLAVEQGKLILNNGANPPATLTPIGDGEFKAGAGLLIEFHRDEHGRVSGLKMSENQARGVEFVRTN